MIIDAKDTIAGRLATYVTKQALLGETIDIVNAEKAVLSGSKKDLINKYTNRRVKGDPHFGPYFPRASHMIFKRMIRGMLPYKQTKGREAFKRIKCHKGVPKFFEGKEMVTLKQFHVSKLPTKKHLTFEKLSKLLGAK